MINPLRRLALYSQGLGSRRHFGQGESGTRKAIEHLGYVQIDTIYVVERAHHHTLWNRVPDYRPEHLNSLLRSQHLFEYWYHAASYLPVRDYRYVLPQMAAIRRGENRYYNHVDPRLMKEILARVKSEGPLRLRHIDKGDKGQGSWWNRGPERRAIDRLFMQGDLMVCERQGMEKVYDLAERCLPRNIDVTMPTLSEYAAWLFDTTLRAHGVFTWKQLLHLKAGKAMRDAMRQVVDHRLEAGVVTALDDSHGLTAYVDAAALEQTPQLDGSVKILSPFDNLIIHRDRLSSLFQFDYRIECYVAAPKRVFGYFCLPVLYGDQFVARIDYKAYRNEQRFEVLSLHLEPGAPDPDHFLPALAEEIQRFAAFNNSPLLDVSAVNGMLSDLNLSGVCSF